MLTLLLQLCTMGLTENGNKFMSTETLEKQLDTIVIAPQAPAQASIIVLHGLGASGNDFVPVVHELALTTPVRFIFPHAPMRPVTLNGGMVMRAWFDIYDLSIGSKVDEKGIREGEKAVHQLIEREIDRGVPAEKIVLAGFSQGGAMALHTGLRYPKRLAGILGLSTLLPLAERVLQEGSIENHSTPIMLTHGLYDAVIDIGIGEMSKNILMQLGYKVSWLTYSMAHTVSAEEMKDIKQWLMTVLGN